MIGLPRIPKPSDAIDLPHRAERAVTLVRPFTPELLERACRTVGFTKPTQSTLLGVLGAQSWTTETPRSLLSRGETIRVSVRSPMELVLSSDAHVPGVPLLDWHRNTKNLDRLALALGSI